VCAFELNPHTDIWDIASVASSQQMSHQLHVRTPFLNGQRFARPVEERVWTHEQLNLGLCVATHSGGVD